MTLKSLEKLRDGYFGEYPCFESKHPQCQHYEAKSLAREIQAEIDEKYTFGKVPDEYWPLLESIESKAKPEELGDMIEICEKYGSIYEFINIWCLRRPTFDDYLPAGFGDEYIAGEKPRIIESIKFYSDGSKEIKATDGTYHYLAKGERLKRPNDTQKKINEDAMSLLCTFTGQTPSEVAEEGGGLDMMMELLARQRKLDGVE